MPWEERGSCLNIFWMIDRGRISETFTNYEAKALLRKHGRSVDHVLTYSGRQITDRSQKTSRITRQNICCAIFKAWEERGSCLNIFRTINRGRILETFTDYEGKDLLRKFFKEWEEHGSCPNIFWTTNRGRISENFMNYEAKDFLRNGFDVPLGVVKAWEERGSCLNIFRTTNRGWIIETFTNYKANDLLRKHGRSVDHVLTYSEDKSQSDLRKLHELHGKRLVAQLSETRQFALYLRTVVDLMFQLESSRHGRNVDHVLTYSGRQILIGSQKSSRITRQMTCCAIVKAWEECGSCLNIFRMINRGRISETFTNYDAKDLLRKISETFTNYEAKDLLRNGFDVPIGVVKAWEERGSCLNIFPTINHGRISETFTNYEANRSGCNAPIGVVMPWEDRGSCLNIFRTINCCSISETFKNYEAIDLLPIVKAWEERRSYINIFRTINHGRISETFTNYGAKDLLRMYGRSVDHVFTYSDDKLRSDLRILHELQGKRLFTQVSETGQFALYLRTVVDLIFQLESSWHERSVDHVLTYSGREIEVGSQKPSRIMRQKTCDASMGGAWIMSYNIPDDKSRSVLRNLQESRGKRLDAQMSETRRFVLYLRTGVHLMLELESSRHGRSMDHSAFDAGIGVVKAWEERGSCLNLFQTKNCGQISETFMNYEAKGLLRKSGFDAGIGFVKAWEKRRSCLNIFRTINCSQISETFTNYEAKDLLRNGFDAGIRFVKAWEERRSCLNIFQTINCGRISETFTNYEAKDLLRKNLYELRAKGLVAQVSETRRFALHMRTRVDLILQLESSCHGRSVDHVLTYSGRQIAVGSQKTSRITRVVKAWEERRSCLNIFRTINRCRILETFKNYEAKDLLGMYGRSVDHVFTYPDDKLQSDLKKLHELRGKRLVTQSGFAFGIGCVKAWEERGSCLNIFRMINRVVSQKPSRITRQRLVAQVSETRRFALYLGTVVDLMFQLESSRHESGLDVPIGVVKAWEDRGPCLNIFHMTNRGRISENFTNYEAKDLLRKHGRSVDLVLTYFGRQIAVGSKKASRITRQKTCCAID
ncbi:uncharacterized protein G2W53_022007 [Senna tora]|uniref:Uncharacterized protein n=1 Tax=Senna tora TaxID=362788 RepID=A0A834WK30_9FABA|nr:uncharacterized protein G2W53_022007 [Senna tora]